MLQISVNRRQLVIFTAVIALLVSMAWVGVASRATAASSTPVVYVATGENFPDALGAGPAAAIVKGPILLVSLNAIPGETAAELTRLGPDKIIIVGGTAVVSASVEAGLAAYAGTVERIAGANRYDTAAKLSAATYPATIDANTLAGNTAADLTSDGFSTYHDASVAMPTAYGTMLELKNLPAGSYVIIGKTYIHGGSTQQGVACRLVAGAQFDEVVATVPAFFNVPATFTVVNTFASSGGTVTLQCRDFGNTVTVFDTKITAISVDGLSNTSG